MQVSLNILLMAGKFLNKWHDKIINAARRVTKDIGFGSFGGERGVTWPTLPGIDWVSVVVWNYAG